MKKLIMLILFLTICIVGFGQKISQIKGLQDSLSNKYIKVKSDARYLKVADAVDLTPYLAAKADTAGQAYTGTHNFTGATITAPTKAIGTNTTDVATTAFVKDDGYGRLIYANNVGINNTGNTTENTLLTIPIPASSLGLNGYIVVTFYASSTSANTNSRTLRFKEGSTTLALSTINSATLLYTRGEFMIFNRNNKSSQISGGSTSSGVAYNTSTAPFVTSTINTSNAWNLTITAQCVTSASDDYKLEAVSVRVYYKD